MKQLRQYLVMMLLVVLLVPSVLARDPTQAPVELTAPALASSSTNADLRVTSILFGVTRRMALINGQWLQKGDTVMGAQIEKVSKNSVLLKRAKKIIQLQLVPNVLQEK